MSAVTILDLARFRGVVEDPNGGINGAEFDRVGLPFIGGCIVCEATIAAYNACPSKSGYLCCANGCIDQVGGWDDVAECDRDLSEEEAVG